jgi:hypothetical protein
MWQWFSHEMCDTTIGLTHFIWKPLSHLSHNISSFGWSPNAHCWCCAINVTKGSTWNVWDQLLTHNNWSRKFHVKTIVTFITQHQLLRLVTERTLLTHDVNVIILFNHCVPHTHHYIIHWLVLLRLQWLLQVVWCMCMMDEVDALQRWRRWGLWSHWIEKFKKVGKIEFARIIFEEFAISFSLWQLIDMQTVESTTKVSSHKNQINTKKKICIINK